MLLMADSPHFVLIYKSSLLTPCLEWAGHKDKDGYGIIKLGGRNERVHRVMYRLFKGSLHSLQLVLHQCDNPACGNPEHLFVGTKEDNRADCCRKFRQAFGMRIGCAKLNDEKVKQLRDEFNASSISLNKMSKREGIARSTLTNVLYGRTWQHVEGELCKPKKAQ